MKIKELLRILRDAPNKDKEVFIHCTWQSTTDIKVKLDEENCIAINLIDDTCCY